MLRLQKEWEALMISHETETRAAYALSVAKGNNETFDEYKEKMKWEWLKDMIKT